MFNFGDKTATHLAGQTAEKGNEYEENIVNAARALVDRGDGHFLYGTQYSSGSTLWHPGSYDAAGEIIRAEEEA